MVCLPIFSAMTAAASASLSSPSNFYLFYQGEGQNTTQELRQVEAQVFLPPFWLLKWEKRFLNPDGGVHAKLMHARYF